MRWVRRGPTAVKKMYELWEVDHLQQLFKYFDVDCVFDVGANAGQYATMRAAHDLTDAELAELARLSFRASRAPETDRHAWLAEVDAWLATPADDHGAPRHADVR